MRCSKCGAENPDRAKFCVECASPFARRCPSCNTENPQTAKFCLECAKPLEGAGKSQPSPSSANAPIKVSLEKEDTSLDGERKTVTALFADIKSSMELLERLDPEDARAIVDPALKLMIDVVHRFDGYLVQSTGDGIFALFGAPVAHEDHPQRALYAALRIQDEMSRYAAKLREAGHTPIEARVGVNTGEVVVRSIRTGEGHTEYAPIGHSISLASRMEVLAPVGSIAATEQVRNLCEGYFQFSSLGPTRVRGVHEPVNVFEVTGLGPLRTKLQRAALRGFTRFVGRDAEMAALDRAAELAKSGRGQIVAVVGEAGVGKSRLFFEFNARHQTGWKQLEAFSVSHGRAASFMPVIDLLKNYFGINEGDETRIRREKIAGRIAMLDRVLEDTLPYVFGLLGLNAGDDPLAGTDANVRRRRTLDAIVRILIRESLAQPLIVVFEDLHWIDDETQALLNLLAESIGEASILLALNYRPEYRHDWGTRSSFTQIRLEPLRRESADEMLAAMLGDDPSVAPLRKLILDKSDATPFFIEEMVQALFEEGVVTRNGVVRATRSITEIRLPATVNAVLAARIDRLGANEKELLQTLAVIGDQFALRVVREVVKIPSDDLDSMLDRLQEGEFIYEQPAKDDIDYHFKHALTRFITYSSILTGRHKLLHERVGAAMESVWRDCLDDHLGELVHHYERSANVPKAVEYLERAGEQAVERGGYAESSANAELALKLIRGLPEGEERLRAELRVRLMEGMTVTALYGFGSTERLRIFDRVCQLSESLGEEPALFRGLLNLGFAHNYRFEALSAQEMARRCVRLGERNLRDMLPAAQVLLAQASYRSGDLLQAASVGSDAMTGMASPHQRAAGLIPVNLWAVVPANIALITQMLGRPDEALELVDEALRRARKLKHSLSLALALHTACLLRYERRQPELARELAESVVALAEEHGFREFLASGKALKAWTMIELNQSEQGIDELEAIGGSVQRLWQMSLSMILAHAYHHLGRAEKELEIVGEELAGIEDSGALLEAAELRRLKGEAILMRDPSATAEAETSFRGAIEIARGQSAKWWELRATTSLARLLRDANRRDEARSILSDVYNWFTEGFDTADLKDAKALLEELNN